VSSDEAQLATTLLEVPIGASDEDIKTPFRFQSKVWHPDQVADPDLVAEVTDRMAALRKAYDA